MQNDSRFPNTAIQVIQAILVGLMQKKKEKYKILSVFD